MHLYEHTYLHAYTYMMLKIEIYYILSLLVHGDIDMYVYR